MSITPLAKNALRGYARSKGHGTHARTTPTRPGSYRPGYGRSVSPKARAAETAVKEAGKALRRL